MRYKLCLYTFNYFKKLKTNIKGASNNKKNKNDSFKRTYLKKYKRKQLKNKNHYKLIIVND